MVSILVIIGCFFLPLIMVFLIVRLNSSEKRKRYQFQAELYAKAIEFGKPFPTDLFATPYRRCYALNAGIICIAAGIGIALSVWLISVITYSGYETFIANSPLSAMEQTALLSVDMASKKILAFASLGIIPFLIGIAFIIIHFLEKEKGAHENAQ